MQIGRKDLLWNYVATSMRILSGIIVLPVALRMLPSEEMGIWSIFLSLMTITSLLDFGFSNSFSRNVTYVYSGVKELKTKGYAVAETSEVDYGLLKTLLLAMKRYYGIAALVFLIIFLAGSPFYISSVLGQYSGDKQTIWIAWYIFGALLAYELYTYYYNSILIGRGLVKRNMQVIVFSQSIRIIVTLAFLFAGLGIISLVLGLLISDVLNRTLARRVFYDRETKVKLSEATATRDWDTIKTLAPNSLKIGFTSLSYFLRNQSIVLIAPFYLSLSQIAEFGISKQLISVISALGLAWYHTYYSQTAQYQVRENIDGVKRLYIKGTLNLILMFIIGGGVLLMFGSDVLLFIKSKTSLLCNKYLFLMLLFVFFEAHQIMANGTLIAKNEVPFFKADIISGICSVLVLLLMFNFTSLGVLSLILATGLVLCVYMNWKVPVTLAKEIQLTLKDYIKVVYSFFNNTH
jgi:O-antigen/teichoic acid export membrane protein